MPVEIMRAALAGTFADQMEPYGIPRATGTTAAFYFAVGSTPQVIDEDTDLCAAKRSAIVAVGSAAVRDALQLGSGRLAIKASELPADVRLFVRAAASPRDLRTGEVFAMAATSDDEHGPAPADSLRAAAPGDKRARSTNPSEEGDAASRKATLMTATKREGKFWACRQGCVGQTPPASRSSVWSSDMCLGASDVLDLVDGTTGDAVAPAEDYFDTEMFDAPDFASTFVAMASEVRKWRWTPTYTRTDAVPVSASDWVLLHVVEPSGQRYTSADEADAAWAEDEGAANAPATDGSFVEVWGRRTDDFVDQPCDIAVLAQFGPHPLAVVCACGHPMVQTADFAFFNSDGSTDQLPVDPAGGRAPHPLQAVTVAEIYCTDQQH